MIMAPVTVAAVSLDSRIAIGLAILALVCTASMALFHMPLPSPPGVEWDIPALFEIGQFGAVAVGLAFFTISAMRVTQDEARLVRALDAAQIVIAREQKLSALGALAAATAHELGTPLATIHLVAKEMAADRSTRPALPSRPKKPAIISMAYIFILPRQTAQKSCALWPLMVTASPCQKSTRQPALKASPV